jgi:endo-1,4-beta-D-glucanase Y
MTKFWTIWIISLFVSTSSLSLSRIAADGDSLQIQPTPLDNPPGGNITYQPPDLSNLWGSTPTNAEQQQPLPTPTLTPETIQPLPATPAVTLPQSIPTPAILPLPTSDSPERIEILPESSTWSALVRSSWEGYKANYIFCGANCGGNLGLVFDPAIGYQAVSEGVGYGMLMAVMLDDQPTFDVIYDAAHQVMLDPETGLFNWRASNTGSITGYSSATDAEIDISAALIFAQRRVELGQWGQHAQRPYDERVRSLLDAMWAQQVADERYLKPGHLFGDGRSIINLSYFAPAWFRLFNQFERSNRWAPLIDQGYESLYATDGAVLGLAPDWSTADGQPAFEFCDQEGRDRASCRYDMTYDAIRVPWRIGIDCLWFSEERACEWSRRSAQFMNSLPDHQLARMYDMRGDVLVDYQDEVMISMWLVGMIAADDQALVSQLEQALLQRSGNVLTAGHWGETPQQYYQQSLALFAAALLSGDFRNLLQG